MLKKNLFGDTEAYLIFDDTVINNKLGYNIEIARRQYSGIGSSSCSWVLE
jgi:hypothetical protein